MLTKELALERFAESRKALMEAVSGLSEAKLTLPGAEGDWSVKDLLCHLSAWETACLEPLTKFNLGQPFEAVEIADHDAWNRLQVDRRSSFSIRDVLEELAQVRGALLEAAAGLTGERWQIVVKMPWGELGSVAKMIDGLAWHEEEHAEAIRTWKKSLPEMEGGRSR